MIRIIDFAFDYHDIVIIITVILIIRSIVSITITSSIITFEVGIIVA